MKPSDSSMVGLYNTGDLKWLRTLMNLLVYPHCWLHLISNAMMSSRGVVSTFLMQGGNGMNEEV